MWKESIQMLFLWYFRLNSKWESIEDFAKKEQSISKYLKLIPNKEFKFLIIHISIIFHYFSLLKIKKGKWH